MDPQRLLAGLVGVATSLGVAVKNTGLRGTSTGGLCHIKGKPVVLLNAKMSVAERCITLADVLSRLNLEGLKLDPELRSFIAYRGRKIPPRSGVRTAGPGLVSTLPSDKRRRTAP